ncbi:MAG TPA: TnsA endonuclease N-terminal domain-containing protein [Pyrinomonadaceae bacterium]|jgi:hypothetical protein
MDNDRREGNEEFDGNEESINYPSPVCDRPQSRYGNNRWVVYSPRLKRRVILYSNLEYDHWVLVEANTSIKSFCEQPRRIRVKLPTGLVTTIFDMWILWDTNAQEYREVKYLHDLLHADPNSRIHRQIQAQKKWCTLSNAKHSIMTDEVIRANPIFLSNWKFILSTLACTQNIDLSLHIENISSTIKRCGGETLRNIERLFPKIDRTLVMASVFTLLHRGLLKASLDNHPLNASTKIDIVV